MTVLTEAAKKIKISPELIGLYKCRNTLIIEREYEKTCYNHHAQTLEQTERELIEINTRIAEQEAKENA